VLEVQVDGDEEEDQRRDDEDVDGEERLSVAPPAVSPPRMNSATRSPMIGIRPACSA
jgi:hypothetical protein